MSYNVSPVGFVRSCFKEKFAIPRQPQLAPAARGEAPAGLGYTGDPIFNRFWTLLGTPCIALPFNAGPFGLPLSVQLIAPLRDDDQLIAWARWVEARLS